MVWNSTSPDGTQSVKQNTTPMQQNTTYTETTMNNDHFWNIGTDEDGRHRAINMENYADTEVGAPTDAPIATGMDGVFYLKTTSGRVQGFYRNAQGIYQCIPAFLSGTIGLTTAGYTNIVAVPDGCYGHVFIFQGGSSRDCSFGAFMSTGGVCQAWAAATGLGSSGSTPLLMLKYGNDTQASGLNLRAQVLNGTSATYNYRVMYWTI